MADDLEAGRLAFETGDLDVAEQRFRLALGASERAARAMLWLGRVAGQRGGTADAVDWLEQALDRDPALAEASVALALIQARAGRAEEARDTLWTAVQHSPDAADAWFQLGRLLAQGGQLNDAVQCLERAVAVDPARTDASIELARAFFRLRRYDDAVAWFRRGLEGGPGDPQAHNDLANSLVYLQRNDEALALYEDLVRRFSASSTARLGYGNALQQLGRFDEARAQYDAVLAREPKNPFARWNQALVLLLRKEFAAGWDGYEHRLLAESDTLRLFPFPRWRGEPLAGKALLIFAEQGVGDEIMFASCFHEVLSQARRCVIACRPKLEQLFSRSFPEATVIAGEDRGVPGWLEQVGAIDFQVAAGSLPPLFRRSGDAFPARSFLRADPHKVDRWRAELDRLGPELKVGVSWRGGSVRTRTVARSIPLHDWSPILGVPGCRFVSLQYGEVTEDLREANDLCGVPIAHWPEAIADYDDTAALVCAVDVVITVCTALVHLSGALGRRAWVLVPSVPEWRYGLEGTRMPWYRSVELVRQEAGEGWQSVLERLRAQLEALVSTGRGRALG
ncbi:MAG: tetratricopeptide repeat protein [Burkholderiales bacterium]